MYILAESIRVARNGPMGWTNALVGSLCRRCPCLAGPWTTLRGELMPSLGRFFIRALLTLVV